ncbi:helix-turn-helix domain-containing protein [Halomonas casei]|uniref:helix-turn-helix domain-containing protein n=1 Tax=Halomonas casei TaxID=2742613 RepID=UPI003CE8DD2D
MVEDKRKYYRHGEPQLVEREGRSPAWVAEWQGVEGRRSRAYFTFGQGCKYQASDAAHTAAKERQNRERENWGQAIPKPVLTAVYEQSANLHDAAKILSVSYPTASLLLHRYDIPLRKQGYNPPPVPFEGLQCRSAREHLGYTRDEMSASAGVGKTALSRFEQGKAIPRRSTIKKIEAFFSTRNIVFPGHGIVFIDTAEKLPCHSGNDQS